MRLTNFILLTVLTMATLNAQSSPQSNQHFSHTENTNASPSSIWNVWTDVTRWKDWDTGLKDAYMDDAFMLGAKGTIISLEGRKSRFTITEFVEGQSYTMKTKLPLGSLYVKRYLKVDEQTTTFTHEVWFKGLTKGVFAKAFGGKFRAMLPDVLENIKQIVEE